MRAFWEEVKNANMQPRARDIRAECSPADYVYFGRVSSEWRPFALEFNDLAAILKPKILSLPTITTYRKKPWPSETNFDLALPERTIRFQNANA